MERSRWLALILTTLTCGCTSWWARDSVDLGGGVTARVASVRSLTAYDGELPAMGAPAKWQTELGQLAELGVGLTGHQQLCGGTMSTTAGGKGYKLGVGQFSSYDKGAVVEPAERFVEITLRLEGSGRSAWKSEKSWIVDGQARAFPARLHVLSRQTISCSGFRVPGVDICPLSLMTSWEGRLGVDLTRGEATWLILLFDVPASVTQAELQLPGDRELHVHIPASDSFVPAASTFAGRLSRSVRRDARGLDGTFDEGQFAITLSPNRSAVVGFSLTLVNLRWQKGAQSGGSQKVKIDFTGFSRALLNHAVKGEIPGTYDVSARFLSPDKAAGAIHVYYDTQTPAGILDLGIWELNLTPQAG